MTRDERVAAREAGAGCGASKAWLAVDEPDETVILVEDFDGIGETAVTDALMAALPGRKVWVGTYTDTWPSVEPL